ncbi:larval cuticle protein A3A-like [Homarus americanus]|uniref:larval cuticle protein A3A-like n=1 Tax=Homarus americanus TaxID=6706 RepID=UPI001C46F3E7|nr:larval cuticle protein A3A-like [Homarus americanus]
MAHKVTLMMVVVGVALAVPSDPYKPPHQGYKQPGMPHNFAYTVRDEYAGTNFGHSEDSDGNTVQGSYNVDLPDGRKQTVTYQADHSNGYVADVQYYGEPQYAHQSGPAITFKPQSYGSPQPSYQPQPSYTPQPSYQPQPSYTPQPSYHPQPSYN